MTTMTMIKQWVIIEDEVEHAVDVRQQENYPVVIPDFAVTKSELRMELHWCPLLDSPVFTISHRITNTIAVITATINGTVSCDCSIQGEKPTGPVSITSHERTAVVKIGESTALFLYGVRYCYVDLAILIDAFPHTIMFTGRGNSLEWKMREETARLKMRE